MKLILEFLVVFTVTILPQILSSIFSAWDRNFLRRFTGRQRILVNLASFSGMILLAIYIAISHPEGWTYVGLGLENSSLTRVVVTTIAATVYFLLIIAIARVRAPKDRQKLEQRKSDIFKAGAWTDLKSFWERAAYLPTLWLGVVAEDLIFRGYLIFGLQAQTGLLIPWVFLSTILSILVHLYQGVNWRIMLGQGIFALLFIGISIFAQNIIAVIIPHLVYDTIWILQGWAQLSKDKTQQEQVAA